MYNWLNVKRTGIKRMKSKKSVTDEVRKTIQEIKIEVNKNIYKKTRTEVKQVVKIQNI